MPVTITFYTVKEKKPLTGDEIIFLKPTSSFGYDGFEPRECCVEYLYVGEDGTECSEPCQDTDDEKILFGSIVADENTLWISVEDYWKAFN